MKAFFFDLDGTLLNTLEDIGNACNATLTAKGYPTRSMKEIRRFVGRGFERLMRDALPTDIGQFLPPEDLTSVTEAAKEYYRHHMCEHTRPYAGITEALTKLASLGCPLAVLSNKSDNLTIALIQHYFPKIPFALVHGARPDIPLKPSPDAALDMLRTLATSPAQAFYVGDSDIDVTTARNASMTSVGVAWGFRDENALRAAQADHIIRTPQELVTLAQQ